MDNSTYIDIHNLPKTLNNSKIQCAPLGDERSFNGHATFKTDEKFRVIQNRKGHKFKILTYVLMHNSGIMLRIDIKGTPHNGLDTPHVHIYDDKHEQGRLAIPLSELEDYESTDEIIESLIAFLDYNNFDTNNLVISESTV